MLQFLERERHRLAAVAPARQQVHSPKGERERQASQKGSEELPQADVRAATLSDDSAHEMNEGRHVQETPEQVVDLNAVQKWVCRKCDEPNKAARERCNNCGELRPSTTSLKVALEVASVGKPQSQPDMTAPTRSHWRQRRRKVSDSEDEQTSESSETTCDIELSETTSEQAAEDRGNETFSDQQPMDEQRGPPERWAMTNQCLGLLQYIAKSRGEGLGVAVGPSSSKVPLMRSPPSDRKVQQRPRWSSNVLAGHVAQVDDALTSRKRSPDSPLSPVADTPRKPKVRKVALEVTPTPLAKEQLSAETCKVELPSKVSKVARRAKPREALSPARARTFQWQKFSASWRAQNIMSSAAGVESDGMRGYDDDVKAHLAQKRRELTQQLFGRRPGFRQGKLEQDPLQTWPAQAGSRLQSAFAGGPSNILQPGPSANAVSHLPETKRCVLHGFPEANTLCLAQGLERQLLSN